MDALSFALILVNVVLGSIGQLLLKTGAEKAGKGASIASMFTRWEVLVGFGLYGMASLLWLKILQNPNVSLSVAYPMIAMSYVVVTVLDMTVLKDQVPPLRWAGLILICAGVALVGFAGKREKIPAAAGPHLGEAIPEVTVMDIPMPPAPAATPIPHHHDV